MLTELRFSCDVMIFALFFNRRYPGSTFIDHIMRYQQNPDIKMIVLLGEVGAPTPSALGGGGGAYFIVTVTRRESGL